MTEPSFVIGRDISPVEGSPLGGEAVTITDTHGRALTMRLSGIDTAPTLTQEMFKPPPGA